jgi:hypothetical protein
LVKNLEKSKIHLYYKEISAFDVKDAWMTVVRVVAPELSMIHADDNAMFLWWRTQDVGWRYKDISIDKSKFPNVFPHPLG